MERFDIIVFGASGFVGKHVVGHLLALSKKLEYSDITWAVAGRSVDKLMNILIEHGADTSRIPVLDCDVNNEGMVRTMCEQARVLMNCVGPYTTSGERVVKACIQTGTHYLDITAELHFMLDIYRKYDKAAEEANVLVIPACGFGSLPGVMGYVHLEKEFKGVLKTVESYNEIEIPRRAYFPGPNKCLVHYGTWASFVYELQNYKQYAAAKRETFPQPLTNEPEPEAMKKCFLHRNKGRYWLPYVGPDGDIVEMTQRYLQQKTLKKPVHFKSYVTMPLLIHIILLVPAFFLAYYLSVFKCFRNLLWKYPRLFSFGYMSHKGPSDIMRQDTKFSFTITGRGWDKDLGGSDAPFDRSMTIKVSGSDPGYGATAMAFLMSAITVLKEPSRMPSGGVLTTGAAFWDTQIVNRLHNNGIAFDVIDDEVH